VTDVCVAQEVLLRGQPVLPPLQAKAQAQAQSPALSPSPAAAESALA
jgi:hypothetical protein